MPFKITDYNTLTAIDNADLLEIVDVSDTTMSANGTNKKITRQNLLGDVLVNTTESFVTTDKNKLNNLTVPTAVNTDTLKSDTLASKNKTDFITVSTNTNLDTLKSDTATNASNISLKADKNPYNDFSVFIPYETPAMVFQTTINASVLDTDIIVINQGAYYQDNDNEKDMINLIGISALPINGGIELTLNFNDPTSGTINLKWRKI